MTRDKAQIEALVAQAIHGVEVMRRRKEHEELTQKTLNDTKLLLDWFIQKDVNLTDYGYREAQKILQSLKTLEDFNDW